MSDWNFSDIEWRGDLDEMFHGYFISERVIDRKEYNEYSIRHQNLACVLAVSIFVSVLSIPYIVFVSISIQYAHSLFQFISSVFIVGLLAVINVGAWYVYYSHNHQLERQRHAQHSHLNQQESHLHHHHHPTHHQPKQQLSLSSKLHLRNFQMLIFLAMEVIICFRHIIRIFQDECDHHHSSSIAESWHCNNEGDDHAISGESSTVIMLIPIMYSIAVRGAFFPFSILLWLITLGTLIFSCIHSSSSTSILFVLFYAIGSLAILLEARRQNYFLFFADCKLKEMLRWKEQQVDEQNAEEMRHMIANVAHDLKTVGNFVS